MINHETSAKILAAIKKANSILLPLHISPDGDCVGSVLAMSLFLKGLGKKVKIISLSKIPSWFSYLSRIDVVEIFDFSKLDFSQFDLFIALDIAQETMITRKDLPEKFPKNLTIINIDHHLTNTNFGNINLVDSNSSSVCEMLYLLFAFWQAKISKETAELLFLGIFADTGCFQYPNCSSQTMRIAAELMDAGANLDKTVLTQFRSYNFKNIKYWQKVLQNMKLDESGKFVWSVISREEITQLGADSEEMEGAASLFCPVVKGTEFGIILDENEGFVKVSLRSRVSFDVSKIAVDLGGGGHKLAAGFSLKLPLEEAEKLVLETARKALK